MSTTSITTIRKAMRRKRSSLSKQQQQQAAHSAYKNLIRSGLLCRFQRIGIYHAVNGELSHHKLTQQCHKTKHKLYLPKVELNPKPAMNFFESTPRTPIRFNQFKIPEPNVPKSHAIKPYTLDAVITPLVGFDLDGNRIGMGGGFYDRTFAYKQKISHQANRGNKPILIGWAYSWQQVEKIPARSWDVNLDAIITDKQIFFFNKGLLRHYRNR